MSQDAQYQDEYGKAILEELKSASRFSEWMVEVISPFLGDRILEIGAGEGNISRDLPVRERLTLTDYDLGYVKGLTERYEGQDRIDVRQMDLTDDAHFGDLHGQYDTVICLNVLEHIEKDIEALKRMRTLLGPDGKVIVLVPQYQFLMSKMDRLLGHYRRYNRRLLAARFNSAGLALERSLSFNSMGTAGWLVNNTLLGRTKLGTNNLRIFEMLVPFMRAFEPHIPHPGLSIIGVGVNTLPN